MAYGVTIDSHSLNVAKFECSFSMQFYLLFMLIRILFECGSLTFRIIIFCMHKRHSQIIHCQILFILTPKAGHSKTQLL